MVVQLLSAAELFESWLHPHAPVVRVMGSSALEGSSMSAAPQVRRRAPAETPERCCLPTRELMGEGSA